jgi:membrane protein involved in colicin uptake
VAWSVLNDFASRVDAWLFAVDWRSFFKDFAGPGATVIAAVVAGYFARQQWKTAERQAAEATKRHGEHQAETAKRQAETALEQFRKEMPERFREMSLRQLTDPSR